MNELTTHTDLFDVTFKIKYTWEWGEFPTHHCPGTSNTFDYNAYLVVGDKDIELPQEFIEKNNLDEFFYEQVRESLIA